MLKLLVVAALVALTCLFASLQKTYQHIPLKELRRRARGGDAYASALYRVANYGVTLDLLLWLLTGLSSVTLFIVLAHSLNWWSAGILMLLIIWAAFAWIPTRRVSKAGAKSAKLVSPVLAKLLFWVQPLLGRLGLRFHLKPLSRRHTGLYEKDDLIELLDNQAKQADNRITKEEFQIARGALTFADKKVREIMTPKRMVKTVLADEPAGPHVMDELHASGFSRFPVVEPLADNAEHLVGTLYLRDMMDRREGGLIRDVMSKHVYYINEEQNLLQAFDAFIKTKHHLFVVVNNFEEITGVLSIEDVLEQILGTDIVDEFDQYEDLRAVAMQRAKDIRKHASLAEDHSADKEPKPQKEPAASK